jgi:hypothetical protein
VWQLGYKRAGVAVITAIAVFKIVEFDNPPKINNVMILKCLQRIIIYKDQLGLAMYLQYQKSRKVTW